MKKFMFWVVFGFVALSVVIQLWGFAETHGVRVDHDIAKSFALKKAEYKVPDGHGAGAAGAMGVRGGNLAA
ncbi:MAG: hypothetical protein ACYCUY_02825 [Acidithiobacillus sp.]